MTNIELALAGNPNCGKTTAFNALTGANQYVGNWPGVTVEKKAGKLKKDKNIVLQDLPGIYSLAPYSPEEIVARDYLIDDHPTAILDIVDATNIERNLYLTMQLMETGLPVVVGMNMMDVVAKQNKQFNLEKLAYGLGVPVVGICALKGKGLNEIVDKAVTAIDVPFDEDRYPRYDKRLEAAISEIEAIIKALVPYDRRRWFAIKLFERDVRVFEQVNLTDTQAADIEDIIKTTEKIFTDDSESIMIDERYAFVSQVVNLAVVKKNDFSLSTSDKIDRIVTNRFLALPIFALVMWLVYYLSIQTVGTIGTDWVNDVLFGQWIPNSVTPMLASWSVAPWMQSLIIDGIIGGVGSVVGFLPQLIVLFICLGILEDCGYMARIAFVMDRMFRKFGLSGKSFIPMLVATGCGVPGIMASRTIESENDRRMTIMVTTFMPCSAKLTIIALVAGAFFPQSSWVAPSAYFVGIFAIVASGIFLKKTRLFAGDPAPFIMELPTYHVPQFGNVSRQVWERSRSFIKKAGTIIFVSCIIIWFLSNFNFTMQMVPETQSMLAAIGSFIAIIFAPLGFDNWRAAVAVITGLVAKENVVGTFGVLYSKAGIGETGRQIWPLMRQAFTPAAGYAFLVFNLLCAPCFAAVGAMRREFNDVKWTLTAVAYQCGLAYVVSLMIYQFAHWIFEGGTFTVGTGVAFVILALCTYGLFIYKPKHLHNAESLSAAEL
ncbi:ferrous iron transport protein B [Agrilactobacillus yilanensis]|uniref:Ferrous iron transport protein B n=1 Tax=Agrilactobacillus yilanensis TaxID=2485997 RepID=A0ABW4J980_9LACO|nr:ferrous iron transport protein B [Agrilactobacillus yilanensis]